MKNKIKVKMEAVTSLDLDGVKAITISNNITKGATKFRYEFIESQLLKNMPEAVLLDLRIKILAEIESRKYIK